MSLESLEESAKGALLMDEEYLDEVKIGRNDASKNNSDDNHMERTDNLSCWNDQSIQAFNKLQITSHG